MGMGRDINADYRAVKRHGREVQGDKIRKETA